MENARKNLQLSELLRKELAQIILREIEFPQNSLTAIINVKTKPDFSCADVFISVTPEEKEDKILKLLQRKSGRLRYLLNNRLARQSVPQLRFRLKKEDTSPEENLEEIFNQLAQNQ